MGQQRVTVASRIAAAMTLSGRTRIRLRGSAAADEIQLAELVGDEVNAAGTPLVVTEEALREVVDTGLFTGTGPDHVAFAHASYQDFLAAMFVAARDLSPWELANTLQLGDTGRPPTPLAGLGAWLATMEPALRDQLQQSDPATVLEGDVAAMSEDERLALAESVLMGFSNRKLLNRWWDGRRHYSRLACEGLGAALRRILLDKNASDLARVVAIDMADAAIDTDELDDALLSVALDQQEDPNLRASAAWTIATTGRAASVVKLKPLLSLPPGQDPQDDLRGYALQGLWPDHLSSDELFAALTEPRRRHFVRAYSVFLSSLAGGEFPKSLLVEGFKWMMNVGAPHREDFGALSSIKEKLLASGVAQSADPDVRAGLVPLILEQLRRHDGSSLEGASHLRDEERQVLADAIISAMDKDRDRIEAVILDPFKLLHSDDLDWVLEKVKASPPGSTGRSRWAKVASLIYDHDDPAQVDAVLSAFHTWPPEESPIPRLVQLGSDEAARMRRQYEFIQQAGEPREAPATKTILLADLAELLATSDDPFVRWANAVWHLGQRRPVNPSQLEAWNQASDDQREALLRLAKSVVEHADPPLEGWLGSGRSSFALVVSYRAFQLVVELDENWLEDVPDSRWAVWAPLIYGYWFDGRPGDGDDKLLRLAYRKAPSEILQAVEGLIAAEQDEKAPQLHLRRAEIIWSLAVADVVDTAARSDELAIPARRELLVASLRHEVPGSRRYALDQVETGPLEMALMAGSALLDAATADAWPTIWARIQRDAEFGKQLLLKHARFTDSTDPRLAVPLSESELADLYTWMAGAFPRESDPPSSGGFVSPPMAVAELRNGLLRSLSVRGTEAAVAAMASVAATDSSLEYLLGVTKENANRERWKPMPVDQVLKMGVRPTAVVVTALRLEYEAVKAHFDNPQEQQDPDTGIVVDVGVFDGWNVAVVETGAYEHAVVGRTRDMIRIFKPKVALFVGVAGALKDAQVGDLVVGESAYLFEAGKETEKGYKPRAQGALPNPRLLELARAEARKKNWTNIVIPPDQPPTGAEREPEVFLGKVVSGAVVVAGAGVNRALLNHAYSDALAVEMEGHGFLHSATATCTPALLVRGISDSVDDKSERDGEGWQPIAASRAAAFALHCLSKVHPDKL